MKELLHTIALKCEGAAKALDETCGDDADDDIRAFLLIAIGIYEFVGRDMPVNDQVFSAACGEKAIVLANIEGEGLVADELDLGYQADAKGFVLFSDEAMLGWLGKILNRAGVMRA